jgi:hypothetical protein
MNDMAAHYTPDPEIGLFGGRWAYDPATHVLRWVQERQPAPMPAEPVLPLCKWCSEPFDRAPFHYCSDECYKAGRNACKRRSITKRGRAKGKCQDCGGATSATDKTRCKPCALSYRSDGKWVGPQRATEAA